ncbi:MAG: Crp/Fnr family transcriptional regulator [Beijerinckiaceae bacterium]
MIHLLDDVEPVLAARYAARITRAAHEPGALLLDFDDQSTDVFFIETGSVRVMVRNAGGREVILGDLAAGEMFGEMSAIDASPRSANITALHRSTVARMSGEVFREMVTHVPAVALKVMRVLTARVRLGNEKLLELATLPLASRLHAELLRTARPRLGTGELIISPPPAQHVLAARVGGRREAVSREMAAMIRAGQLLRTPAALVIRSPEKLRADLDRLMRD